MSLYKQFGTDKNLEKDGIDLEYGTSDDGQPIIIRIARAGGANQTFSKIAEHKLKPYRRQIQNETADKDVIDRAMREVYADAVILGWTNVRDRDENVLEFTKENVLRVLEDLPDLWADIQKMSGNVALFREEIRETDAGN